MGVAVMAVSGRAAHLFNGNDAAVELFASFVFKLNCRVLNRKMVTQNVIQLYQNAGTLRRRNVGDADMAGERMAIRSEAPHMQIVDIVDALNLFHA